MKTGSLVMICNWEFSDGSFGFVIGIVISTVDSSTNPEKVEIYWGKENFFSYEYIDNTDIRLL